MGCPRTTLEWALLDSRLTVLRFASTMTYHRFSPVVKLIDRAYQTAVRLSHQAMTALESRFQRLPRLGKWFVRIVPLFCGVVISLERPKVGLGRGMMDIVKKEVTGR